MHSIKKKTRQGGGQQEQKELQTAGKKREGRGPFPKEGVETATPDWIEVGLE
jgi:hypothetical protein